MNKMAGRAKHRKYLNANSSYTTVPISFKLHRNVAEVTLYQNSNQSTEGAGGLGIIRSNKVGENWVETVMLNLQICTVKKMTKKNIKKK